MPDGATSDARGVAAPVADAMDDSRGREPESWQADRLGAQVAALAAASPYLIGVRHHSPALALAVPALLDAYGPDRLYVELPSEAQEWIEHLAAADAVAPLALVVTVGEEVDGFYPFADFSPELAALRWAREHAVPVTAFDLSVAARLDLPDAGEQVEPARTADPDPSDPAQPPDPGASGQPAVAPPGRRAPDPPDLAELWDTAVEAHAYGADPEQVRRAALAVGLRQREADSQIDPLTAAREACMRTHLAVSDAARPAVIAGAFHIPAIAGPAADTTTTPVAAADEPTASAALSSALIGYDFALLDSRSGYPAGIRDPEWQQSVWQAHGQAGEVTRAATAAIAGICFELRAAGHTAGTADVIAARQLLDGLVALRGLAAPGRRELIEALATTLGKGEPLGRARAVARAAEKVLVGSRRGAPGQAAPRTGLSTTVPRLLAELSLPGPGDERPRTVRLDPFRSRIDRRRDVTLRRMNVLDPSYATARAVQGTGGADAVTAAWDVAWTPMTAASLIGAAAYGIELGQACRGLLRRRYARASDEPAAQRLALLETAARCGLADLTRTWLDALPADVLPSARLTDLLGAHRLLTAITAHQIPPLTPSVAALSGRMEGSEDRQVPPHSDGGVGERARHVAPLVLRRAVAALQGLGGAASLDDARAIVELTQLATTAELDRGELAWRLEAIARDGAPLAAGAASASLVLIGRRTPAWLAPRIAGWLDGPHGAATSQRIAGALLGAEPLLEASDELLDALRAAVARWGDEEFLDRLPTTRGGFAQLAPAARDRLLAALGIDRPTRAAADPRHLAAWARADLAGQQAVQRLDPDWRLPNADPPGPATTRTEPGPAGSAPACAATAACGGNPASPPDASNPHADVSTPLPSASASHPPMSTPQAPPSSAPRTTVPAGIGEKDRWRLILAAQTEHLTGRSARLARSLDELYGAGRGEGAGWRPGGADGSEGSLGVREWGEELAALFGPDVRDEVLATAAEAGRVDALLEAGEVTASVDLLERILSLAGALPESKLSALRALARRMVDQLARQLADDLRPALAGLATHRPTRRPGGPLDVGRTISRNLSHARIIDGRPAVVPEHPVFRTRQRRTSSWHIHILVDVSGSMEASTIYAALLAGVLHAVPALEVRLATFSTQVVDLTDRVADPLSLLLEIAVGGGTDIASALTFAAGQVRVPTRTILAVVSDFEEGGSVTELVARARQLAESGVHLLGLAAVDGGQGVYNAGIAGQLVAAGMPVAALSPLEVAQWIGEKVRGAP